MSETVTEFVNYKDVKDQTTEGYFNGNRFSIDAFNKKYSLYEGETYVKHLKRVCDAVASVEETEEKQKYWSERWFDEIYQDWWSPAGSISQGAGSNRGVSLANCTTISLGTNDANNEWDNLESIIKNTAFTVAKCAAYRQGLGVDFSRLRPSQTKINNSANESTGSIHWMKFIDSIGYFVGQKGRIPAMLFSLSVEHPDIEEFIKIKSDFTLIQNANISVQISDNFYKAVEKNDDWKLKFETPAIKKGDKVYIDIHSVTKDCQQDDYGWYYIAPREREGQKTEKTIKAKYLLELIAQNMLSNSEPGIQNIDIAKKNSNSDYLYKKDDEYDPRIISTNACQPSWARVLTPEGISTMGRLNVGDKIWSQDGWVTVIKKWSNGIKPIYRAETSSGIFYGTLDHKVISEGRRVSLDNAEIIDFLPGDSIDYEQSQINIQDVVDGLVVGDGGLRRGRNSKYNAVVLYIGKDDRCYFDSEITEFLLNKEYSKGTCEAFNISACIARDEVPIVSCRYIPDRYLKSKNRLIGFLRGLFSANGTVSTNGVSLKTTSPQICEDVLMALSSLGIRAWKSSEPPYFKQFRNGVYACKEAFKVNVTVDYDIFHKLIGFIHPYKNKRLQELVSKQKKNKPKIRRTVSIVKSITEVSEEEVFDITVDGKSHTYWTGGCNVSNCSEQYLSRESLCVLSSINCANFSTNIKEYEKELEKIGASINRFLDNVNEYELQNKTYATPHQRVAIEKLRRTGAGYTNIAGWLFKMGYEYGSESGNKAIEKFTERYNYHLYCSSINLGHEKGSFGLFVQEDFEKSPFVKRMKKLGLEFDAMRNVTCSSIAPTGSLSLMFRDSVMSYGVEPAFGVYFWKRTRISGEYKYYFCVPSVVRKVFEGAGYKIPIDSDTIEDTWDGEYGRPIAEFIDKNAEKVGVVFKAATEISAMDKLDLMARVAKNIDSSISVTYMLPENTDWKDVYEFILEAWRRGVKSVAAFPDRKMYGIVSYISFKDLAFKLKNEGVSIHAQNFTKEEQDELNISEDVIDVKTDKAPKRPKELEAEVFLITAKSQRYIVAVGLLNGQPYEVFGGKANGFNIKKKADGKLVKHGRGKYGLVIGDIEIDDFAAHFSPEEQTLFRTLSTMLRHGIPIEFVCEQMQKSSDDMFSLPAAVARVLKKYIKDGQKVAGASCPSCGDNELIYSDGCVECRCGWSRCS